MSRLFLLTGLGILLLLARAGMAQSSAPAWGWVQGQLSTSYSRPADLATDGAGNTIIVGTFSGSLTLSPTVTLATATTSNPYGYIAKYDPTGTLRWAFPIAASTAVSIFGLAVDAAGNSYLTGSVDGTATAAVQLGSLSLTGAGDFLAKLDPQGAPQWLRRLGTNNMVSTPPNTYSSTHLLTDISLDSVGNIYLAGWLKGSVAFGTQTVANQSTPVASQIDLFVVKYDPTGTTARWARQGGRMYGASLWYNPFLTVAPSGEAYLSGALGLGAGPFGALPRPLYAGDFDVTTVKYSAQGDELWQFQGGGAGADTGGRMALVGSNHLALGLSYSGTATFGGQSVASTGLRSGALLLLNTTTGTLDWVRTLTATGNAVLNQAGADAAGNIYVTGAFGGTGTAGTTGPALSSAGGTDAVVLSFTSRGVPRWVQQAGGPADDNATDLTLGANGRVCVAGTLQGSGRFGMTTLTTQSTSATANNGFLAQLAGASLTSHASAAPVLLPLYPNPAHNAVSLPALPPGSKVTGSDSLGRLLFASTTDSNGVLSLTGLAVGSYQLQATATDGRRWAGRLVVE